MVIAAHGARITVKTCSQRGPAGLTTAGGPEILAATVDQDHRLSDRDRSDDTASPSSALRGEARPGPRPRADR